MTDKPSRKTKIYMIAGETSGDILGAGLIDALIDRLDDFVVYGVGGPQMEDEGLSSLFPMNDLSVMGIAEILPRLPKIMRRISQTVDDIIKHKPDIVITIDSPDFCFRVARKVKERMGDACPVMVHYVAPTVWAWRAERAKKIAALYDGIICLLPIEPPYFTAEGMKAAFTGHPATAAYDADKGGGPVLRRELGIADDATVLGILFGSRIGELQRVGPILRQAAFSYAQKNKDKDLHILAPTLPHLRKEIRNLLESMPCRIHVVDKRDLKWHCFDAMDMALATSGTVGMELAIAGVPHIIGYKVNYLTWRIVKSKITTKYAHLANILLDQLVVPEFLQQDCTPEKIGEALGALSMMADDQKQEFAILRDMLRGDGRGMPSEQAADFILSCLDNKMRNRAQ